MPNHPIIVAAVDFDRRATAVIAHAAPLAALCQGHLMVVHVVDDAAEYESELPFPQRRSQVLDAMVRHARASLVGMVNHLDLPNDWVEIRVETGPVIATLTELAGVLKPRYCVVGQPRLGILSPTAGLAAALAGRSDCDLVAVPGAGGHKLDGMIARVGHWLGGDLGTPSGQAR